MRTSAVSLLMSNASCASNCIRNAISSEAIRDFELVVIAPFLQMLLVHLLQQVELPPLDAARHVAVVDIAE